MTDGPYRMSRNPMLTGTFVYLIGLCILLWTWQALVFFVVFVCIMLLQVRSEEKRLRRDFGEEYETYCRRTGRFLPFNVFKSHGSTLLISFSIFLSFISFPAQKIQADEVNISTADTTNQTAKNIEIYNRVTSSLQSVADKLPMQELVVLVALQLLETPYLWASLESEPEQLQVFLDKTDCILFVELSTCFALTLKGKRIVQAGDGEHFTIRQTPSVVDANPSYMLLCDNIRNMRYRLGLVDGYSSRVHYTSEWLLQNQTNGILHEYTKDIGVEFEQNFFYMSAHPMTYYQLSHDVCELGRIRMMEEHLNAQKPYFFISQEELRKPEVIAQIKSGDIITFISPRPGLDLAHVAIAYEYNGGMHFIHASYGAKKVIIEPKNLADYAVNGIRISRLNDVK